MIGSFLSTTSFNRRTNVYSRADELGASATRQSAGRILSVVGLLLCMNPVLAKADRMSWSFFNSADEARLVYGIPESDSMIIALVCNRKRTLLITTVLPAKRRSGPMTTTLSVGSITQAFHGSVSGDVDQGYYAEAVMTDRSAILKLLSAKGSLAVQTQSEQKSVPLRGIGESLRHFKATCG